MQGGSGRRPHCSTHSKTSSPKCTIPCRGSVPALLPTSLGFRDVCAGSCGRKGSTAGSKSLFPSSWGLASPVPEQQSCGCAETQSSWRAGCCPATGASPFPARSHANHGLGVQLGPGVPAGARTPTSAPAVRQALVQAPPGALGDQLRQVLEVEDEHDDDAFLVLHGHHVHQAAETRRCRAETGSGGSTADPDLPPHPAPNTSGRKVGF